MGGVGIWLSGSFAVSEGADLERPGPAVATGSRKARRLLALLAVVRGRSVSASTITAALWGGAAPQDPEGNVATLVSRLRATLGPGVVLGDRSGYRLGGPPAVRVDLDAAAGLAAEARRRWDAGEAALAAVAAHRGLELAGSGEALAGEPDAGWVDDLRREVETLRRDLRQVLAEAALAAGDPQAAIDAARTAADADPLDDRAHRALIAAHHAAGEPDRALAAYERLRVALAEGLGADPAPQTRALHAAVLRGEPAVPTAPRGPHARRRVAGLVGRSDELATLGAAWAAAVAGDRGLWLVAGEPGIGKTALAEALAGEVEESGGLVLRARCYAAERSLFLQPVLDAVGPYLRAQPAATLHRLAGPGAGVLAGLLPDLSPALGEASPSDGAGAELQRRRAFDAVRDLVARIAGERPVLLLLDDLHSAGMATVELLHYLARHLADARLLILATVRSEEGADALDALARRVRLGPLPADAVTLLAARSGSPRLAEDILRRTRGHTLFVVETLRALAAGERGVPESLQAAVTTRLRHVGEDVERVLRAAAVLGEAVPVEIVAAMLGRPAPEIAGLCERAARARLLVPAGSDYEFANDLVQEVVRATTPEPVRGAYHRRAADLLADRPEELARHAEEIGDWARAARSWLVAGQRAIARSAAADAGWLLDRAVHAAERVGDPILTGRVRVVRARGHEVRGDFAAAEADMRVALDAARSGGDRRLEMTALRRYTGEVYAALGLPEQERRLDGALRIAEELVDRAAEADLCSWQAVVAANRLRFDDAVSLGRRAVAAARAADDDDARAAGLDGVKTAYAYLGDVAALVPVLAELEPLARRRGSLQVLYWTLFESALPAVAAADWDTALRRIDQALAVNRRSAMASVEPWFLAHQGWVQRLRGRTDEAVTVGRQAVELASAEHPWWCCTAAAMLAATLLEQGDPAQTSGLVPLLTQAHTLARAGGTEAYVLRCLAPLAEATGDTDTIVAADALLGTVRTPPGGAWLAGGDAYLSVARAWLGHGDPARARAVLAPFLVAAGHHGWIPWQAAGALVDGAALAALGEVGGARAAADVVRGLAGRHGMSHLAERADELAASVAGRSGAARRGIGPPGP
ncbi:AAA family ATPase [Pseudonocardia sp.]|uniref:ATP-binding protein n=1 Tax=Pseudonocardia sp. TaxID=60912 RepID=UPI00261457A6|nr:AAA family ATPase [Pseudonocardia sp.]